MLFLCSFDARQYCPGQVGITLSPMAYTILTHSAEGQFQIASFKKFYSFWCRLWEQDWDLKIISYSIKAFQYWHTDLSIQFCTNELKDERSPSSSNFWQIQVLWFCFLKQKYCLHLKAVVKTWTHTWSANYGN